MSEEYVANWRDFTVDAYAAILETARQRYVFANYLEDETHPHVLWRHDVDFSVHRALRLARLEAERGLCATYFFGLGLWHYNPMEPAIRKMVREILSLTHRLGLHFDQTGYEFAPGERDKILAAIAREADFLGMLAGQPPEAVSFHDPTPELIQAFPEDEIAGLVNAYSLRLREDYLYCSDSNGYWRHQSISEVLESGESDRLQILTHPVWWTEEPMAPRARVERCVRGRAEAVMRDYDRMLAEYGRLNIGGEEKT